MTDPREALRERLVAVLSSKCGRCGGRGRESHQVSRDPNDGTEDWPCPSCRGTGTTTRHVAPSDLADAVLDALGDVLAENERHRRANLVRAVLDGWDEDIDGALTDYINEHGWDAVPWKIAERLAAPSGPQEGPADG